MFDDLRQILLFSKTFSLAVCLILVVAVTISHGKANCPTPTLVCDADEFTAGKCILEGNICCEYVFSLILSYINDISAVLKDV